MNLTNLAHYLKRYLAVTFILIAMIGVLIIIGLANKNKNQANLPKITPQSLTTFQQKVASFNTQNLVAPQNIPNQLPVFNIDQNTDYLSLKNQLALKLGINSLPVTITDATFGAGVIFANQEAVLSVYKNSIAYQKLSLKPQKGIFNVNQETEDAKKYLETIGLDISKLVVIGSSFKKIQGDNIIDSTDPQNSDLIRLDFGYSLAGIPAVSPQTSINTNIDASGSITSFNFRGLGDIKELASYPLISFDDAVKALSTQGKIIDVNGQGGYASQLSNIGVVQLKKAYLAYYLSKGSTENTQPFWIFEGNTDDKNSLVNIQIAVPAIKTDFFTQP